MHAIEAPSSLSRSFPLKSHAACMHSTKHLNSGSVSHWASVRPSPGFCPPSQTGLLPVYRLMSHLDHFVCGRRLRGKCVRCVSRPASRATETRFRGVHVHEPLRPLACMSPSIPHSSDGAWEAYMLHACMQWVRRHCLLIDRHRRCVTLIDILRIAVAYSAIRMLYIWKPRCCASPAARPTETDRKIRSKTTTVHWSFDCNPAASTFQPRSIFPCFLYTN
jgi:hypothetical protein